MSVFPKLEGIEGRTDTEEARREAALTMFRQAEVDLVIYTGGSAMRGTRWGGAAMVVTDGEQESPSVIDSIGERGFLYTFSYEEVEAMKTAVT